MKQNSKHWLNWKGTRAREGNQLIFARPYTPAIQSTEPNYLRKKFAEIRADLMWADAMEKQNPALIEAVQQIEFKWDEDYAQSVESVKDPKRQ